MNEQVQALLEIETEQARRAWILETFPTRDDNFIAALREEALRLERDDPREALKVASAVADAAAVWDNEHTRAFSYHMAADAHRTAGNFPEAEAEYVEASTIFESISDEPGLAGVFVGFVDLLRNLGRLEEALELSERASALQERINDQVALAKTFANRSNIYYRLGRYQESLSSDNEARQIFAQLDDPRHVAMLESNSALTLVELNEFRQAEALFRSARTYFEAEQLEAAVAQIDHNLGCLFADQGDYQRALLSLNQARNIADSQENQIDVAFADWYRSNVYLALNIWQEALRVIRDARPAFETARMPLEVGQLWLNEAIALARGQQGDPAPALSSAREQFAAENNTLWLAMVDFYAAGFALQVTDDAPADLNQALMLATRARPVFAEAGMRGYAAHCAVVQGEVALQQANPAQAQAFFEEGLNELGPVALPAVAYRCRYGFGRAAEQQGDIGTALASYRQAIDDIEQLQAAIAAEDYKIAFLTDKLEVYEALVLLLLSQESEAAQQEAFETVERAKSRALLDAMAREMPDDEALEPEERDLLTQIEELKRDLTWFYNRLNNISDGSERSGQRIAEWTEQVASKERELKQLLERWRSPDLATSPRNPIWTVGPTALQAALPDDTLLLEYYTAGDRIVAFGLTHDRMWSQQLSIGTEELATLVAQLRFQLNKFSYGAAFRQRHMASLQRGADEVLQRLYDCLVAPLEARLSEHRLMIVPHGVLHYVPFQALCDDGEYLIQRHTISYAPSATVYYRSLVEPAPQAGSEPLVLGLQDSTIPFAHQEAQMIADLFPSARLRLGEEAVWEPALHRSRPAFLHLSTHATFRDDNPLFSALKLADRWLSVHDLYDLPATAPLVTLSACETGRNQIAVGDELVGLCRGFFTAGAQSLVVSLWMVDDSSTARLMTRFYQELKAGSAVSDALRTAQLMILDELPHPYYWAPFILTGSPSTRLSQLNVDGKQAMAV